MNVSVIKECSGCGACAYICPAKAIIIKLDEDGFFYREVDEKKCINCGKCAKVCSHNGGLNISARDVRDYTAYRACAGKDIAINSSSGGIAYLLMKQGVAQGDLIVGVHYNTSTNKAEFGIANEINAIENFRGSKYIQADPSALLRNLDDKHKYVFIGSPCQVYGYATAAELKGIRDNFLFVDFFCHGVPSYLIWNKVINEYVKGKDISRVSFRDKQHGYHKFHLSFELYDGKTIVLQERKKDEFYTLFDCGYLMSSGCYKCPYRYTHSFADIRIGDLWDDNLGEYYSRVVVFSDRGQKAFADISKQLSIEKCHFTLSKNDISRYKLQAIRKKLIEALKTEETLKEIASIYKKHKPVPERIKCMVKTVLKKLCLLRIF